MNTNELIEAQKAFFIEFQQIVSERNRTQEAADASFLQAQAVAQDELTNQLQELVEARAQVGANAETVRNYLKDTGWHRLFRIPIPSATQLPNSSSLLTGLNTHSRFLNALKNVEVANHERRAALLRLPPTQGVIALLVVFILIASFILLIELNLYSRDMNNIGTLIYCSPDPCPQTDYEALAYSRMPKIFISSVLAVVFFVVAVWTHRAKIHRVRRSYMNFIGSIQQLYEAANHHEEYLHHAYNQRITELKSHRQTAENHWTAAFRQKQAQLLPRLDLIMSTAARLAPAWDAKRWQDWQPDEQLTDAMRFGVRISDDLATTMQSTLPALFPFPAAKGILIRTTAAEREKAMNGVQSLLLRLLAAVPPSKLRFTFIDPVGRGQNAAGFLRLGDYDPLLVTSRVWTEPRHVEERLSELTEHMENVIQKYLRSEYATIEAYNEKAGEIAEAYRFLVVYGFPVNFNEDACRRLISIAENGPRCGVYTIVLFNAEQALPYGFSLSDLERSAVMIEPEEDHFIYRDSAREEYPFIFDTTPEKSIFDHIVETVGAHAKASSKVEVPFRKILPASTEWWGWRADDELRIPLGPSGARKIQYLELGQGTAQHVLVVGRTGAGKSTLLDTLITSLALTYSPDEAELYLIDLKKGVGFKPYATHKLPHASVIAIESEREFALSTLEGLNADMERRGKLFRAQGVDALKDYRSKSGEKLSRILLLIDEFQELFTEDDQIARSAQQILDRLVRQGRAFGIHVMLGSQSLAGSYSLTRSTIDQMAVRIALQSTEADSRLILADDNPAARLLSRAGEAIYNASNGLVEGNNLFQVAYLKDDEHELFLRQISEKWNGRHRRTQIVFEGTAAADIEVSQGFANLLNSSGPMASGLRAYLGEPVAITDVVSANFRRQSGSNLVIVTRNDDEARGMITSGLVSLIIQLSHEQAMLSAVQFYILDFSPVDTSHSQIFKQIAAWNSVNAKVGRRNQIQDYLTAISSEMETRIDSEESGLPPVFFIIYGLHKARDLRQDEERAYGIVDEADSFDAAKVLNNVLRQGPEVGIHTVVWCDTVSNLNRAIDYRVVREFGMRVASHMSDQDSTSLLDTPAASKLVPHRAIFYDDDDNRLEKLRPFLPPSPDWMEVVRSTIHGE